MAWLWVVLVSLLPLVELKGGIPVGLQLGLSYPAAFGWALLGSSLVCVPLLLTLRPLFAWAKKQRYFGGLFTRIESVFAAKVTKDGPAPSGVGSAVAVFLFSLLPLPGAGVWTASFLAVLMGLPFRQAVLSVVGGNLLDGILVLLMTKLVGKAHLDIFLWVLTAIIGVSLIIFFYKISKVHYYRDNDYRDGRPDGQRQGNSG